MASIEEILATAEDPAYVRVVTARIALVPQALRDEHAALEARLAELVKSRDTVDIPTEQIDTAERLGEIEAAFEAATVEFRFRCIGHRAWADLIRKHPPTDKQKAADRRLDHNPDTFPYEAMAASSVDPQMTPDDVRRLEAAATVDVTSWAELWGACLRANVADDNPKSVAASILRRNGGSARPLTTTGSLAADSSDG